MTSAYVLASLDDLGIDHRTGFWGAGPEPGDGGQMVQVVRNGDIRPIGVVNAATCPVRRFTPRELEDSELRSGDVLVTTSGEPGKSAYWGGPQGFAASNFVRRLRPPDATIGKYLFYFLRSQPSKEAFARHSRGVAIKNLSRQFWDELRVPVRGVGDIAETVAAIESLFTRLDDAVASLERVRTKLKAYRASVLKAAVEGRLVPTEASLASAEKRDYEPAGAVLARILKERRRRWEEAGLAKFKAAGKAPKDDKWKAKYEEPVAPDTDTLPELAEGWCWATVDMLASVKGGLTKGQRRDAKDVLLDVPYLRVANVQRGYLDLQEVKTIKATRDEVEELRLEPGDVLFNEGGDRDKLGRGWIWSGEIDDCVHQNHVFRARIFNADYEPRLLSWYGNSSGQRYFFDEGKQTTNLASINMTKLKALPVPIPPKSEQARIADEVERVLSVADENAVTIENDIKRCLRLRQAVLKWAFEGKLVDQDPADEPPETLLARIRAERAAIAPVKKNGGHRAKGAA